MSNDDIQPASLDSVLTQARHLLIAFDGTICSLFAGSPAGAVTSRLRKLITDAGIPLAPTIQDATDWLAILVRAHAASPALAARVADELTAIEAAAVATAIPIPYAHDAIAACLASGRSAAIISNNSEHAIHAYLHRHNLAQQVTVIAARTGHDPATLMPSPHLVEQAARALGSTPGAYAVISHQASDIRAARAAGAHSIGYAHNVSDAEHLTTEGAQATIVTMADLTLHLRAKPLPNLAVLDQGGGAARRRARRTRAGHAALGGRPVAAQRAPPRLRIALPIPVPSASKQPKFAQTLFFAPDLGADSLPLLLLRLDLRPMLPLSG